MTLMSMGEARGESLAVLLLRTEKGVAGIARRAAGESAQNRTDRTLAMPAETPVVGVAAPAGGGGRHR